MKLLNLSIFSTLTIIVTTTSIFASQHDPIPDADFDATESGFVQSYEASNVIDGYARLVGDSYRSSLSSAERMQQSIMLMLDAPSEASLAAARFAWINTRTVYLQTEAFRFYEVPVDHGPDENGEEGLEGRINAWPMNEAVIDYVEGNAAAGIVNDGAGRVRRLGTWA